MSPSLLLLLALGAAPALAQQAPQPSSQQAADDAVRRRDADRLRLAVARKTLHDCQETGSTCPKSTKRADDAARQLAADQAEVNAAVERLKEDQHAKFQDLLSRTAPQRQQDSGQDGGRGQGGGSSGESGGQKGGRRRHRRPQ